MEIDEWWPKLGRAFRSGLVDNMFSAVGAYALEEIEAAGGPARDDPFWDAAPEGDGRMLPQSARAWIIANAEESRSDRAPDPRAAYFRQVWPRGR